MPQKKKKESLRVRLGRAREKVVTGYGKVQVAARKAESQGLFQLNLLEDLQPKKRKRKKR